jgi:hypothetical protein
MARCHHPPGVGPAPGWADLALLRHRSEGWAAALQMAALSLRGAKDSVRLGDPEKELHGYERPARRPGIIPRGGMSPYY